MNYNTEKSRKKVYTIKKRIFTGLLSFFNACVTMYFVEILTVGAKKHENSWF